ncbi:hypothetical protein QBC36DRAFT_245680 [Triangularia setosa]|uniref:Uncharacterized protein n=1 Tax=Triangularia setosa TaxID=2587417 RepID=A0AAN6W0U4_9PEZI|nr:hypothetical protein QBC36DRAFT_245680 [Podospora setosa]
MPPRYHASPAAVALVLRAAPPPPASGETSGVVILLAVLGSALFAILFFWGVKRCYWDGWWYTGTYYPIPVEVVWLPNNRNDSCSTCSGESHITVPSTDSPSSSSSPSLSIKPGAGAGAIRLISKEDRNGLEHDDLTKRDTIMPNDATNNELQGGTPLKKGDGAEAHTRICVDLKQLDSGPSSSTVMSQCGTEARNRDYKVEVQGREAVQKQESRSCILM